MNYPTVTLLAFAATGAWAAAYDFRRGHATLFDYSSQGQAALVGGLLGGAAYAAVHAFSVRRQQAALPPPPTPGSIQV